MGGEACGYPSEVDLEGTKLELLVVVSGLVLCEDSNPLDGRVVKDLVADDMVVSALDDGGIEGRVDDLVSEVLAVVEWSSVLCED